MNCRHLLPVTVLSLVWRRYNAQGALASMTTGLVAVPVFKFALPLAPGWGPLAACAEELTPAFVVALAAGVIGTLVGSRRAARTASAPSRRQETEDRRKPDGLATSV